MNTTDCMLAIMGRRSVRQFKEVEVEEDKVLRILEAGRRAPSAKNRQPWRFIVTRDPMRRKTIQDIAYGEECVGNAPMIISVCTTNIEYKMPNGQLAYPVDLTFAVSFMMLQAQTEGLGSCVITTFNEVELKELLTVPYSMRIVMLLLVGVPLVEGKESTRKPLEKIVSYEHW